MSEMRGRKRIAPTARELLISAKLKPVEFPRSALYDPEWVLENTMGPNVLWLTESLSELMTLQSGMRVLDMGCGKAVSSIFLAKEFGVQVWATDLWIDVNDNRRRIAEAGVDDLVFPVYAEAHALPYAESFFDALVSFDAYHYFGTNDLYLGRYFAPLVRPGGQIGIVVPGVAKEFEDDPPAHLAPTWERDWEFWSFHSPAWWRNHWGRTGLVDVEVADLVPNGWRLWADSDEASLELGFVPPEFAEHVPQMIETLRTDAGSNLGFTRVVARRKAG
jgi:cyclopropane fatty-acyl-phospholipid synthase-like methyltransferase